MGPFIAGLLAVFFAADSLAVLFAAGLLTVLFAADSLAVLFAADSLAVLFAADLLMALFVEDAPGVSICVVQFFYLKIASSCRCRNSDRFYSSADTYLENQY